MTGPTQNLGHGAQGLQILQVLLEGMTLALTKIGASTPPGQAVAKAIVDIGKHVPPGATSPQGASNALKAMALRQNQMQPHKAAQAAMTPGAPPPGGAAPAPPPMAA
jgi:hypothetical protein